MPITIQEEWAHTGIDCNNHQLEKQMCAPLKFARLFVMSPPPKNQKGEEKETN